MRRVRRLSLRVALSRICVRSHRRRLCSLAVVATDYCSDRFAVQLTLVCVPILLAVMSVLPVDIVASGPFRIPTTLAAVGLVAAVATNVGPRHAGVAGCRFAQLGRMSYEIYLWSHPDHAGPLPRRHPEVRLDPALPEWGLPAIALALVATFAIAAPSYRWIEQPFLRGRSSKAGRAAALPEQRGLVRQPVSVRAAYAFGDWPPLPPRAWPVLGRRLVRIPSASVG